MTNAFRELSKQKPVQDDGYGKLLCTEPGCGHRWSVNVDRPYCTYHASGKTSESYASLASSVHSEDQNHDGRRWARRIVSLSKSGGAVRPLSLSLARSALKMSGAA